MSDQYLISTYKATYNTNLRTFRIAFPLSLRSTSSFSKSYRHTSENLSRFKMSMRRLLNCSSQRRTYSRISSSSFPNPPLKLKHRLLRDKLPKMLRCSAMCVESQIILREHLPLKRRRRGLRSRCLLLETSHRLQVHQRKTRSVAEEPVRKSLVEPLHKLRR